MENQVTVEIDGTVFQAGVDADGTPWIKPVLPAGPERKVIVVKGVPIALRRIPAGNQVEECWMMETLVTQRLWEAVMGSNPSYFTGDPQLPVEQVSYFDIMEFAARLSALAGIEFKLPTEGQWEHACRAGSTGERYGELEDIAWYSGNSGQKTHPVGQKQPNAWGLYDMIGNLWEYTCDPWRVK